MDKLLQVVREFYNKIWIDRQTFYKRLRNITTKYGWTDKLFTMFTIGQGILQQNKDGQTNFLQEVTEYHSKIWMGDRQTFYIFYKKSGNIKTK